MKSILSAILLLLSANAVALDTYVSPSGNDANNCLTALTPCATIQAAADKSDGAIGPDWGIVHIADGTYSCGANVTHFRKVQFIGNPKTPANVVITACANYVFYVQDHATIILNGMTLSGGNVLQARQFAILDYENIVFGAANIHVYVLEGARSNCGQVVVAGSATYHVLIDGMSTGNLNCATTFVPGLSFTAVVVAWNRSFVSSLGATYPSSATPSGYAYINDYGSLINGASRLIGGTSGATCGACISVN